MTCPRTVSPDFGFCDALVQRLASEASRKLAEVEPERHPLDPKSRRLTPADPRPGLMPPPGGWDMDEIAGEDDPLPSMRVIAYLFGAVVVVLLAVGFALLPGGAP